MCKEPLVRNTVGVLMAPRPIAVLSPLTNVIHPSFEAILTDVLAMPIYVFVTGLYFFTDGPSGE